MVLLGVASKVVLCLISLMHLEYHMHYERLKTTAVTLPRFKTWLWCSFDYSPTRYLERYMIKLQRRGNLLQAWEERTSERGKERIVRDCQKWRLGGRYI